MNKIINIVKKDLLVEFRTKEIFPTMFIFSVLILLVFNFAFEFKSQIEPNTLSAILWVTFIFAGMLGLSRSFSLEKENNAILGLILTPVDRTSIFFGKFISTFILTFFMELLVIPVFMLFFNLNIFNILLPLLGIILLGTVGFITIGAFFSAMSVNTRLRELMLPVLIFPLIIPVIYNSVRICSAIMEGKGIADYKFSLQLLISFDIIFLAVCAVLFEYLIEDS